MYDNYQKMMTIIAAYLFIICCMTSVAQELNCNEHTVSLTGGGSSLAASIYTELGTMYSAKRYQEGQKVAFSYKSRNSGYGLGRITMSIAGEPPIVFGAADKPMSEKQSMLNRKLITFPTLAGALLVIYNLPEGGNRTLVLTGKVLAEIYRGKITHWDDREIEKLNEGITFSHNPIRLVVRSDYAGETFIFTGGLSKFDHVWNVRYGAFSNPQFIGGMCCNSTTWPLDVVEFFANGVHGMIGIVGSIPYTIGYASEANVFESGHVSHANFINKADRINKANQVAVQAAMDYYIGQPRANAFVFDLNNALSPEAYPLASFSYIVVNSSTHDKISCCQMQELVGFMEYLLESHSSEFTKHYLVPLSPLMVSLVMEDAVKVIQCDQKLAYTEYKKSLVPKFAFEVWHGIVIGLISLLLILVTVIVICGIKARKDHKTAVTKWLLTGRVVFSFGNSDYSLRDRSNSQASSSTQGQTRKFNYIRGEFEGNSVMLDRLSLKRMPKSWNHSTQALVNSLREDVIHKNVLNLLGVAEIDGENHTVMEYASKGTLHYILKKCRYDVNDPIKYNLSLNVAEGLAYLHKKQIVHGQLSSINCYLDGSWTIKIAGWYRFVMMNKEEPQRVHSEFSPSGKSDTDEDLIKLMYMDPDLIGENDPSTDIFSLGLLWVEIFTRKLPFSDCSEKFVQDKFYKSADLMKSKVNLDDVPSNVKALISICIGSKDDRPSANGLCDMIKKLKPNSNSIIDVMMENMDQYTTTLEAQVDQQAGELSMMSKRMNDIYCKLLPTEIASKIQKGEAHNSKFYECITICSFTVVGFNDINSHSKPSYRVLLMNDLSTLVDDIIVKYDVTKVYTVGSGGYMACSGLPKPNKMEHSKHVADFSIALVEAVQDFKMAHLPVESPSIRCGIESGPVTAGIVGTEIPQYCIFGETINMTTVMENTSEPMKIQVSQNTCELLQADDPRHKLELRGQSEIIGQMTPVKTYWLAVDTERMMIYNPQLPKI